MKKFCLFLSAIFLFLMLPVFNNNTTEAAEQASVKIGLYYNSKAQSQITISADKGVAFSAFDSAAGKYYPVYSSAAAAKVNIVKDNYFTKSGTTLVPATATNATMGPFHIQVKSIYPTYNDTKTDIDAYKQKGVTAYPVYTDEGWLIWTGFYASKSAAEGAQEEVGAKLGVQACSVVDQVNTRMFGADSTGQVLFMYASARNLLRGQSLSTENPNPVSIGGTLYRGQVEFQRLTNSDMTIINVLPMEEYLYGVVPSEIEAYSNAEAIKAQAVAARTYALKSMNKHASYGFNLCSTNDCQVYKGYGSEKGDKYESSATNKAVDDTRGMVVTYNGKLAETVFFSSSGGKTEAAVNVWGTDFPYLQSVEDKYESGKSYMYRWNMTYTVDEISQKLKIYGVGTVTGMEITKYSSAGRPIEIIVRGTLKPEGIIIAKDRCRTFLSLYSQWYSFTTNADINVLVNNGTVNTQISNVTVVTANGTTKLSNSSQTVTIVGADGQSTTVSASPTKYYFTGKGWGHGVGLSQEGAKGMANAGYTFDQILAHYYTGTKVEQKY